MFFFFIYFLNTAFHIWSMWIAGASEQSGSAWKLASSHIIPFNQPSEQRINDLKCIKKISDVAIPNAVSIIVEYIICLT